MRDFVYNGDRQLTAENWMNGGNIVATMAYSYDLAGELTSASDASSAYAFAYNGDGQVTSVDNAGTPNVPDVVLSSTYDALRDRTSLSATIAGTAGLACPLGILRELGASTVIAGDGLDPSLAERFQNRPTRGHDDRS